MSIKALRPLIKRYRQGEEHVFVIIFQQAQGIICNVKKRYPTLEWDHEDMMQEARIVMHQVIQKITLTQATSEEEFQRLFFGYYQRSLFNHCLNQLRREQAKKRKTMKDALAFEDNYSQMEVVNEDDEHYIVTQLAVRELCQRHLTKEEELLLHYRLKGYNMRECASKLNRGLNYTRTLL